METQRIRRFTCRNLLKVNESNQAIGYTAETAYVEGVTDSRGAYAVATHEPTNKARADVYIASVV